VSYSQGKVVAKLINARLRGKKPEEEYIQTVCYAMVSDKEAITRSGLRGFGGNCSAKG
jgi:sulfide dehydrogenase [flavocytochrome c] flavoprotein subunit